MEVSKELKNEDGEVIDAIFDPEEKNLKLKRTLHEVVVEDLNLEFDQALKLKGFLDENIGGF